jgi:hypothetical protein
VALTGNLKGCGPTDNILQRSYYRATGQGIREKPYYHPLYLYQKRLFYIFMYFKKKVKEGTLSYTMI